MKKNHITTALIAMTMGLAACSDDRLDMMDEAKSFESQVMCFSPLTRAMENPITSSGFRRSYGVGFSYDAIWGEKCNLKDIRSQVFDIDAIYSAASTQGQGLLRISRDNQSTITSEAHFSRSEYEQNLYASADAKANLIVISGKGSGSISIWEGGQVNSYYSTTKYICPSMAVSLDARSLAALIEQGRTELLSKNFRECIDWLAKYPKDMVVDSFLQRYGSHVVISSKLGGSLTIDMRMKLDSVLTVTDEKMLGNVSAAEILKVKGSSESHTEEAKLLSSAECKISVKGGDLSKLPASLLHFTFAERPNLGEYVSAWAESINFDPDDISKSNLEMAEMEVLPIWDFIPNEQVAKLVKQRIMSTSNELLEELGYQNGVSTAIELPQSITCKVGGKQASFSQPAMTNVICAGRYVASICRERINSIDPNNDVLVVYPIYDRQLNLSSGFCISNGKGYRVRNVSGGYVVRAAGETTENKIYLNIGVPGIAHYDNLKYLDNHQVIACEWPYSITKEGALDSGKPYYTTYKKGISFLLRSSNGGEQKGKIEALPNWTYDQKQDRMVRNNDYHYYWNPKEVNY